MDNTDLGMNDELAAWCSKQVPSEFTIGRVTREHRERYVVTDGEHGIRGRDHRET
jgi:hypothetical protein